MKTKSLIMMMLVLVIVLGNCSVQVPMTTQLISRYGLTESEMTKIQYYLSEEVVLAREVTTVSEKDISESHSLRSEEGKMIEEIVFRAGLPGIAKSANNKSIQIQFEQIGTIEFTTRPVQFGNSFRPDATETKFYINIPKYSSENGEFFGINYQGNNYQVSATSWKSYLIVEEENLKKIEKQRRAASGMTL